MAVHRNVRLLAWFNFLTDFRPYGPVAVLYFSEVAGSFALGMSVFSLTMLSGALLEVPTGLFSDMIGRKKTLVCGALASVLSLILYALGGSFGLPALFIGAVFEGLARAFYSGNNDALLHDSLAETEQEGEYQDHLGRVSSMYQFALAISAILGSVVASVSFAWVMWLSVVPHALNVFVSLRFVEPKVHTQRTGNIYAHLQIAFQNIIRNRKLRTLSAASIFGFALGESSYQFRSTFIQTLWPVWAIGVARAIAHFTAALSYYFAGPLIRRFGEFRLMIGGMTLSELINLGGLVFPGVLSPAIMALNSVFFGVNNVAVGGMMQREFTTEQRATMGSLNAFAGSLMFALVSVLLGALADNIGPTNALIVATVLSVIPISLFYRVFRTQADAVPSAVVPVPSAVE